MGNMKRLTPRWIQFLRGRITVGPLQDRATTACPQQTETPRDAATIAVASSVSVSAIESLQKYFREGGSSIVQAAFAHTYFVHPDRVREQTPYYPGRARFSRRHYPSLQKGDYATWSGDGREVRLDDNQYAQSAWARYTRHEIVRGSGYGLRHIWGNPWDPDAFTAGWNFCYMPFWAGMLTERHHPLPELEEAIRQASWDLYFRDNPVCKPPEFVQNPGVDLASLLHGQPILVLYREASYSPRRPRSNQLNTPTSFESPFEHVRDIRRQTRQSWVNIYKASRLLQEKPHGAFGTLNVENGAKSCVRKIHRETGLSFEEIEALLDEHGLGNHPGD